MHTELNLEIGTKNAQSVITDCYFTAPLKIGQPHTQSDRIDIICMYASAGLLNGDIHTYTIRCKEHTKSKISDQSYTKIFDTQGGMAQKTQQIYLEKGASLFYCPHAVIPFRNSAYTAKTTVTMEEDSEFLYTDIFAAGRVGMGEKFLFQSYQNRVEVLLENRPVWMDHTYLNPGKMTLDGPLFFDGATHMGTLYYYGPKEKQQCLQNWMEQEIKEENLFTDVPPKQTEKIPAVFAGISQAVEGICIRALAHTAQEVEDFFTVIEKKLVSS